MSEPLREALRDAHHSLATVAAHGTVTVALVNSTFDRLAALAASPEGLDAAVREALALDRRCQCEPCVSLTTHLAALRDAETRTG